VPPWMIFVGKTHLFYALFIWTRGTLPRLRIDQLMGFAWKFMLPLALANLVIVATERMFWVEQGAGIRSSMCSPWSTSWPPAGSSTRGRVSSATGLTQPDEARLVNDAGATFRSKPRKGAPARWRELELPSPSGF